jgi:hypothetical protein
MEQRPVSASSSEQPPLETTTLTVKDRKIRIPTSAEILRIKGVLILKRNATRDYLDFAALANHLGPTKTISALKPLDNLYPQPNKASTLQQLQIQLADPQPFDLEETNLKEYKNLVQLDKLVKGERHVRQSRHCHHRKVSASQPAKKIRQSPFANGYLLVEGWHRQSNCP